MATATRRQKTKKPTPLSTRSLAAFLTWKQFDLLLLLEQESPETTGALSADLTKIQEYDIHHGGAFYTGISYTSVYSSLRTLSMRQLVNHIEVGQTGYVEWAITQRGRNALKWLEKN